MRRYTCPISARDPKDIKSIFENIWPGQWWQNLLPPHQLSTSWLTSISSFCFETTFSLEHQSFSVFWPKLHVQRMPNIFVCEIVSPVPLFAVSWRRFAVSFVSAGFGSGKGGRSVSSWENSLKIKKNPLHTSHAGRGREKPKRRPSPFLRLTRGWLMC